VIIKLNQRKLLWKAFDLPGLISFLNGDKIQLESEPDSGNGFFGKGAYFYESIQKALESTLVYSMLQKKGYLEHDQITSQSNAGLIIFFRIINQKVTIGIKPLWIPNFYLQVIKNRKRKLYFQD
jgi:hypothetical protein